MSLIKVSLIRAATLAVGVFIPAFAMAQQAPSMPTPVSPGGAGIVSPGGLQPQEAQSATPDRRTTIGVSSSYEKLTGDQANWRDYSLRLNKSFGPRHILDAALTETRRFDRSDTQASGLYTRPLTPQLNGTVEGNISPTHRILPRYALGGTLQYEFQRAWLVHGGLRTTEFNDVRVNQGLLMLEHYFSDFSWAFAYRPARAFSTTANSVEVRGAYYYGDRNAVTLSLSGGREATSIGTGVVLANVRTIAVFGRHWLNRDWTVNYVIGHTRQGDFYTKNGISLGVGYAF